MYTDIFLLIQYMIYKMHKKHIAAIDGETVQLYKAMFIKCL